MPIGMSIITIYLAMGRVLLPAFFFLLLIISCSRNADDDRQVFRYNQPEGLVTLDPAFAKSQPVIWATHQVYNTLVEIDENLHVKPSSCFPMGSF